MLVVVEVGDGGRVAVLVNVAVGDDGSVAVLVTVEVGDDGSVAVLVIVAVGDGGSVAVLVNVAVGDGRSVAVKVEVGRFVGVLLGTQPPCIRSPEIGSNSAVGVTSIENPACINEAFTALNDRQVNGINRPIKSASKASKMSVVRFLFLSSTPTSLRQWPTTP